MRTTYLGQNEIRSEYQAIFWYTFSAEDIIGPEESWLIEFVHSESFKESVRPEIVKQAKSENHRFLESAFNLSNLEVTDFRALKKEDLIRFFHDYAQLNDWGEDRAGFIDVMDKFDDLIEKESSDKFFLLSKEWFDKDDRVLSQDSWVYTYYFLIIWIDIDRKIANVCEWIYD
jgi:hypothetical protein